MLAVRIMCMSRSSKSTTWFDVETAEFEKDDVDWEVLSHTVSRRPQLCNPNLTRTSIS